VARIPVVSIEGLGKRYSLQDGPDHKFWSRSATKLARKISGKAPQAGPAKELWALKDVTFDVNKGERIGIIGRNGAGKSTLLKILSRVVAPTTGEARIRGRLTSLLEVGTGFNDNLTGRENIYLNASLYGLSRAEVDEKFETIVAFSEVARFIDTAIKKYSSGMKMRLAFAVAAHLDPDILLMDEVLAVGDMAFQQKCLERIEGMTSKGQTLLLVSHSMDAVSRYCDRCIWLDQGQVLMDSDTQAVISTYVASVFDVRSDFRASSAAAPVENGKAASTKETEIGSLKKVLVHSLTSEEVELTSASITDTEGANKKVLRVDEEVLVEFEYKVLTAGIYVPAIHVYSPQGALAFVATPSVENANAFYIAEPQVIRSIARIPAHLLNIGIYRVSIVLFNPFEAPFKRYIEAEQLLSFHMIEAIAASQSARGVMPRPFPGPVRPRLEWTHDRIGASVAGNQSSEKL
jgi:lipopolysaccharide transport system ATP-binding protein